MPNQKGGNPPSQDKEGAGDGLIRPTAHGMSTEEGGDPPTRQRALPAHGMPKREEGSPRRQEAEDGAHPEQRAHLAHGMHGQGASQNPTNAPKGPPKQRAL